MPRQPLIPGNLPPQERRSAIPRHILSLAGGGFRGLFTAKVLERMEAETPRTRIASRFDLLAGTSIGGILAIGLAAGVSATDLVALMREHGPTIFRPKLTSIGGFVSSRYDSAALRGAIIGILGTEVANREFCQIPMPLVVVAVDEGTSSPRIFRTNSLAPGLGDQIKTIDVALATSAAPTFFQPHIVGDHSYVDGGLIANAPDIVAVTEAMQSLGARLDDIHVCAVGTAGSSRVGTAAGRAPGKIGWGVRHGIIELIMDSQSALVADQLAILGPASVLRIDRRPGRTISLDDIAEATALELLGLADQAVDDVQAAQMDAWRRFLAHTGRL
jgi:uncharacterized protein